MLKCQENTLNWCFLISSIKHAWCSAKLIITGDELGQAGGYYRECLHTHWMRGTNFSFLENEWAGAGQKEGKIKLSVQITGRSIKRLYAFNIRPQPHVIWTWVLSVEPTQLGKEFGGQGQLGRWRKHASGVHRKVAVFSVSRIEGFYISKQRKDEVTFIPPTDWIKGSYKMIVICLEGDKSK